ncbi:MAG: hypothetical protein LBL30_02675 [Holosporales bacterium]|jgi:hypothetical protein|nr:hypothetical protein [Holosporales bacterium]
MIHCLFNQNCLRLFLLLSVSIVNQTAFASVPPQGHPDADVLFTSFQVPSYGQGIEAEGVRRELGDFDYQSSRAQQAIIKHFGSTVRLKELKAIVESIRYYLGKKYGIALPKPSRNAKRNMPLLVKYIDEHYDHVVTIFSHISLCDKDKRRIPLLDARQYLEEHRLIEALDESVDPSTAPQ